MAEMNNINFLSEQPIKKIGAIDQENFFVAALGDARPLRRRQQRQREGAFGRIVLLMREDATEAL